MNVISSDKVVIDKSWNFENANTKEYTHCYHTYPAMMIPQVARRLLQEYKPLKSKLLFDPYCGTGTSLVEANLIGLENVGTDLNPLARLISKVKNTLFNPDRIKEISDELADRLFLISIFNDESIDTPDFQNINYWFSDDVKNKLSLLLHSINTIELDYREFFMVPFSETVRESSFTRNGEFKLFRIEKDRLPQYNPDVFGIFLSKLKRNLHGLTELSKKVKKTNTTIYDFNTCNSIPDEIDNIDIVITSPPYGDSRTTVAYGQFSRLSSQWLNFDNASKLDTLLMGGNNRSRNGGINLTSSNDVLNKIKETDLKRYNEVLSFLNDYKHSIDNISKVVRNGGVICYVVGNRRVKEIQIPLDEITVELFNLNGFDHIKTIIRNIPNKRMPSQNSPTNKTGVKSNTMSNEYIVILKK